MVVPLRCVMWPLYVATGLQASQLVLSTRTAWVRCPNGEMARRYGISEKNPAGDYWKKVPGLVNWLTGEWLKGYSGENSVKAH